MLSSACCSPPRSSLLQNRTLAGGESRPESALFYMYELFLISKRQHFVLSSAWHMAKWRCQGHVWTSAYELRKQHTSLLPLGPPWGGDLSETLEAPLTSFGSEQWDLLKRFPCPCSPPPPPPQRIPWYLRAAIKRRQDTKMHHFIAQPIQRLDPIKLDSWPQQLCLVSKVNSLTLWFTWRKNIGITLSISLWNYGNNVSNGDYGARVFKEHPSVCLLLLP